MHDDSASTGAQDFATNSIEPAYGLGTPALLAPNGIAALNRQIVDLTPERALFEANAALANGSVVRINAGGLGHTPDGRGRRTGPSDNYWRDYCNTTAGKICFGPYHDLDSGVYVFYYDLTFQIPACGGSNDTVVFSMDTTQDVGHTIPGSSIWGFRWKFMCDNANQNNVFEGEWGGRFAIANPTSKVEMRLGNNLTRLAGAPIELLVRSLSYWKE